MRLYDHDRYDSGNCYCVRLMLSLLGLSFDTVVVDVTHGENRSPDFLRLNPRGQVPVLEDAGESIWDSMAILLYLGRKHGADTWLPTDARSLGQLGQWLALSHNEIFSGLGLARSVRLGRRKGNLQELQNTGECALQVMERQLATREWLACGRPTVADVACYPYVAMASEAGISLDPYPAVTGWIRRIQCLPGYLPLPASPVRPGPAARQPHAYPGADGRRPSLTHPLPESTT